MVDGVCSQIPWNVLEWKDDIMLMHSACDGVKCVSRVWPEYGFKHHKGYGTEKHIAALLTHGPCDIHRRSFAPLKDWNIMKGAS